MKADFIVLDQFEIERFPGKGGWSYVTIPNISPDSNNPFGWVKVKGSVDDYELNSYKLMPDGKGGLFLPIKAAIRKQIKKQAGDLVRIELYYDHDPITIPYDLKACFDLEESSVLKRFLELSEGVQKRYIDWIQEAKKEETKAQRILKLLEELRDL